MRELLPYGMLLRNEGGRVEELSGKVAVVTGGASGIALGSPKASLPRGMAVAVADVDEASLGEVADHVVRAIRANCFYVLPHHDEDHLALVRQRTTDIIEEGSPALPTIPGIGPVLAALAGPAETC